MLRWPTEALKAIPVLFRRLQNLEVYVEDDNDEVFYLELFKRISPKGVVVARVVSLGGRTNVIEACKTHNFNDSAAIFIVDGDLYWVADMERDIPRGAYEIPSYCIENLLICRVAACDFLYESDGKCHIEDIEEKLNWAQWQASLSPLVELFIIYAAAHELRSGFPTVSNGIGSVITGTKGSPPELDIDKIQTLKANLARDLHAMFTASKVDEVVSRISERVLSLTQPEDVISGKDFLVPLLMLRCRSVVKRAVTKDSFRLMMIRRCDTRVFEPLSLAMRTAASGRPYSG